MDKFLLTLKIVAAVYLGIVFLFFVLQTKLIFYPQPLAPSLKSMFAPYALSFKGAEGHTLHGWYRERDPREPVLMYFGGNAEEVSSNLATFDRYQRGSMLLVNYRGYGESKGTPSANGLKADGLDIFDQFVTQEGITPENVIVVGRSLGSGIASHVAANRAVGGMIFITPMDSLSEVGSGHYPFLPVKLLLREQLNPIESIQTLRNPEMSMLSIMGTADRIIPNRHTERLFEAWPNSHKNLVTIQHANHNDISNYDEFWSSINTYLDSWQP